MTNSTREIYGFLSYVHEDDTAASGRITELRRRLVAEIQLQRGAAFSIFQDRDDIIVGEQWRNRIENSIDETTLLVAIITPAFLNSENCRAEIELFVDRERRLGRDDLIIPILYIDTPELKDSDDEIAALISKRQWFEWTDLRFEDFESSKVRREMARLAQQVIKAIQRSIQSNKGRITPDHPSDDDGPGFLELQAEAEDAMEGLVVTVDSMTQTTERIAEDTSQAADAITAANSSGKPASTSLATVQRLSRSLETPAGEMENLADVYLDQVARVGGGIGIFVEQVASMDEEELEAANRLMQSIGTMLDAVTQAFGSLQEYQAALVRAYPISRSLKPVLRRIHASLEKVVSSKPTYITWYEDLADALAQRSQA